MTDYNEPGQGTENWDEPLNENFGDLSIEVADEVATWADLPSPTDVSQSSGGQWPVYRVAADDVYVRVTDSAQEIVGGLGSADRPLPEQHVGELSADVLQSTAYIHASEGPNAVTQRLSDMDAEGNEKVVVYGDNATWGDTVEVPSGMELEFVDGLTISVPSDHSMTGYDLRGQTITTLIHNDDHANGNADITIRGGSFDFADVSGVANLAALWLHNVDDYLFEDVNVENVQYDTASDTGVTATDSIGVMRDCVARRVGYDGLRAAGDGEVEMIRCKAWDIASTGIQAASMGDDYGWAGDATFRECETDGQLICHGRGAGTVEFIDCDTGSDPSPIHVIADDGPESGSGVGKVEVRDCSAPDVRLESFGANLGRTLIKGGSYSGGSASSAVYIHPRSSGSVYGPITIENVYSEADRFVSVVSDVSGTIEKIVVNGCDYLPPGASSFLRTDDASATVETAIIRHNVTSATGLIVDTPGNVSSARVTGNEFTASPNIGVGNPGLSHVRHNNPTQKLSSPPVAPSDGSEYYDDGTNTASGTEGVRAYLAGSWVDAYTA